MDGVFIGVGPAFKPGARLAGATLLDIAPTVLHLLEVPVPGDMDGRILDEILDPALIDIQPARNDDIGPHTAAGGATDVYSPEDEAVIEQRLADLGYL
jgi:hypothetical protein